MYWKTKFQEKLSFARWLTTAKKILMLYVATETPSETLIECWQILLMNHLSGKLSYAVFAIRQAKASTK